MDLKAIMLVGAASPEDHALASGEESFAGVPLALCDVLGASLLERTLGRLRRAGVSSVAVVLDAASRKAKPLLKSNASVTFQYSSGPDDFWATAEMLFDLISRSADVVLVQRLGFYTEIDYEKLVQQHLQTRGRLTAAFDPDGTALESFALSASKRTDAVHLFRNYLRCERPSQFVSRNYWNPLRNCGDLRTIAMDAFLGNSDISPVGVEVKPGVWLGTGARIHRGARVIAPSFIGAHSCVRAAAVLTRGAVVEHHCEIDCGSVLEGASVLPYSYVGAGLDFAGCVIGFAHIAHLGLGVSISVGDPRFVAIRNASPLARSVDNAWALLSYLPHDLARGLFRRPARTVPCTVAGTTESPVPTLTGSRTGQTESIPTLTAELATARRYGNE